MRQDKPNTGQGTGDDTPSPFAGQNAADLGDGDARSREAPAPARSRWSDVLHGFTKKMLRKQTGLRVL